MAKAYESWASTPAAHAVAQGNRRRDTRPEVALRRLLHGMGLATGPSAAEIRAWAQSNGHDVPERGRIPADVREAFESAN